MKPSFEKVYFIPFVMILQHWDRETPLEDWVTAQLALPQGDFEEAYGPRHAGMRHMMGMYLSW